MDSYETEDFPLTIEGLAANQAYFAEQKKAGNPAYKYAGNCTKWFADQIVEKFGKREWERIKKTKLPSPLERPLGQKNFEREIQTLVEEDTSEKTRSALVRSFHAETFELSNRDGNLSPAAFWEKIQTEEKAFKAFYANRLRCSSWFEENSKISKWWSPAWPDHMHFLVDGFVPDFIWRIGVDTSRRAPMVSYFKPALAKKLVKKWLADFSEVYDPFSGLSGRLLGVLAAGKKYVGRDLNKHIVDESEKLMETAAPLFEKYSGKKPVWDLGVADAVQPAGKRECVLTCSPYGKTEQWRGKAIADRTCDEWIDVVLASVEAERYVFVVDGSIEKWKPFVEDKIVNTSHFGSNEEMVVVVGRKELSK